MKKHTSQVLTETWAPGWCSAAGTQTARGSKGILSRMCPVIGRGDMDAGHAD